MILAAAVATTPVVHAARSITQHGITWTFAEDRPTGRFVTGDYWVVGPVTITSITPNPSLGGYIRPDVTGHLNGTMVNPAPESPQGWDVNAYATNCPYDASRNVALNLPVTIQPDSSVVTAKSQESYPRWIKTMGVLTVLENPAPPGSFRPGLYGSDKTLRWNADQIDWSKIPSLTPPSDVATPTVQMALDHLKGHPWIEYASNWQGEQFMPEDSGESYGRSITHKLNYAAYQILIDIPREQKETVLHRYLQAGIDIHDYIRNGGRLYADGGWKQGRKLPVVFAAHLLGEQGLRETANGANKFFPEDSTTWFINQSDVGRPLSNPDAVPYTADMIGLPEWGIRHSERPEADNAAWATNYRDVNGGGLSACATFARLLGAEDLWNWEPFFAYHFQRYYANGSPTSNLDANSNGWHAYTKRMYDIHVQGGDPPPPAAAAPSFSVPGGTYESAQSVTITSSTPGATIRYTTDGSEPGSGSPVYSGAINVSSSLTIRATAYADGFQSSPVATSAYVIGTAASGAPVLQPSPGAYSAPQQISLSSAAADASIHYTTDGSAPSASSPVYSGPFELADDTVVKAIAIKPGLPPGDMVSGSYLFGDLLGDSTGWKHDAFAERTSPFALTFRAVPAGDAIDGVMGVSSAPASGFADLAAIVRFAPDGRIDVRNGGWYTADAELPYQEGVGYTFRLEIDLPGTSYDVTVTPDGEDPVRIASGYAFRTEQSDVDSLAHLSVFAPEGHFVIDSPDFSGTQPPSPPSPPVVTGGWE